MREKREGHALNLDETLRSELASKIEQVLSTGKYKTVAHQRAEKVRPKSSYVRASKGAVN